jgi:transcription initiation factor TFIIIB Brf1 subunit/transcription initiation factor TFIIB
MTSGKSPIPNECPNCGGDDLCIDNVEGIICEECGVWFDAQEDGTIEWVRASRPQELE